MSTDDTSTSDGSLHSAAGQRLHRRIFISSSNVDLHAHRAAVVRVLREMGQEVIDMKDFGAQNGDATKVSLEELAEADVVVFVVAWRYGTLPENETRSVTHLEYLAAKDRNLPRLVFLADPATEADDALFPLDLRNAEHHPQLQEFRAELAKDRVAAFFTEPNDLANHVAAAVNRYLLGEQYQDLLRSLGLRPPRDLPPPVPGFVGRERELVDLCEQLRTGHSTGLSAAVAGMAGVGKSALASEAVHRLAAEPGLFPGGITFVRCDGQTELAGLSWVYDRLLAAWNVDLSPEQLARATTPAAEVELRERALRTLLRPQDLPNGLDRTVQSMFRGQQALVLLDNVEPEQPLSRLLEMLASLGLTALVTARHRPSSPRLHLLSLEVLDPGPAVQLFAERFQARGGLWKAGRDEGPARDVVEVLGHLPLAIELAAAQAALSQTHVAEVASELHTADRLGQLRDPLDPTRSIRYAFEQSLSQLAPQLQLEFAALSLPAGPDWPRDLVEDYLAYLVSSAAEMGDDQATPGVGGAPGQHEFLPQSDAREQARADLDALVARSLVSLILEVEGRDAVGPTGGDDPDKTRPEPTSGGVRVRLHPLLREFAATTWTRQSEATRQQGAAALLAAVGDLVAAHAQPAQADFRVLAQEEALLVGALDGVVTREAMIEEDTPAGVRHVVNDLGNYLNIGSHWQLGLRLFAYQLDACRSLGDRSGEGTTLNNLGHLALNLGQPKEARHYFEQALAILREVGDRRGEGTALNNLGQMAADLGQPEEARHYFEQALAILREVGDRRGEGTALNNLGSLADRLGQPEEARHYYEQALAILREVGGRSGEGTTLSNLGLLALNLGQPEEARHYFEQALAILREVGNRSMEGTTLNALGGLADSLGQREEARHYFEQALAITREVGNRSGEGATLNNLGSLADRLGQREEARHYYEQALAIRREVGDRSGEGTTLSNLGLLALNLGQPEEARYYFEQALAILREVGNRSMEGTTLNNLGHLAWNLGQPKEARHYFEQALAITREVGDRSGEGSTLNALGGLADRLGQREEARHYYEQALAIFETIGAVREAKTVRNNLLDWAVVEEVMDALHAKPRKRRWWPFSR